jgi:hypothetical protein
MLLSITIFLRPPMCRSRYYAGRYDQSTAFHLCFKLIYFHLKPLEIPDLDSLNLKDKDKEALAKACAKYNRVVHLVEELRQRYQTTLDEALVYQKNVLEAEKSLFQIRSEVNYTTSLARSHSNIHCTHPFRILNVG